MSDASRFRPVLWALVAVCFVAGLIAVPLVGQEEAEVRADGGWVGSAPGASSTTTTAPLDVPTTVADGGGDGGDGGDSRPPDATTRAASRGAAPSAPSTTAEPTTTTAATLPPTTAPSEDLGAPVDPGPATPPRPGAYRTKLTSPEGEREMTTRIEDKGATPTERRQLVSMRGGDFDADNDVAWRGDGVYVLSTVITFGQSKGTCDWSPDTLQLRLPITKGATWESSSTCGMTGLTPTPVPLTRKVTGKVLELRRVRVAGQVVDVWAIEGTEHLDGAGRSVDRAGVVLFSPKHGIVVSESGKVTTQQGTFDYRSEAQNLDPEP